MFYLYYFISQAFLFCNAFAGMEIIYDLVIVYRNSVQYQEYEYFHLQKEDTC
jgi:hypothetical protein